MTVRLLDTNVVSSLFNPNHKFYDRWVEVVEGCDLAIALMTRAELLLWPVLNDWGVRRQLALKQHISLYTDPAARRSHLRNLGSLVTGDHRDFAAVEGLELISF